MNVFNDFHVLVLAASTGSKDSDVFLFFFFSDMFLALDKDTNGTLSKQELKEYADGTLTEIFIERGRY